MVEPWGNGGEAWKGGDDDDHMIVGATYSFTKPQTGAALLVRRFSKTIPVIDDSRGSFEKTFERGVFVGRPKDCDWLPARARHVVEQSPYEIMIFVGTPRGEYQQYMFCIADTGDGTEIVLESEE